MVHRSREPRIWLAIFRRLVRLYPRAQRRAVSDQVEVLFLDLYAEARADGRSRAAWFALRACLEMLPRAFQAHGDPDSPTGAFIVRMFFADLRHAWQVATRQRRHSAVVVTTMAIGIGATTAVFSVTDAALLRRLPFPDADRLVDVAHYNPAGWSLYSQDDAAFRAWSEQNELFGAVWGYDVATLVGQLGEAPHEIDGVRISPGLLPALGARPVLGRLFQGEDAAEGAPPVALISERLARQEFGLVGDLGGRSIDLDGTNYRVVGVLPLDFAFPYARTDVWLPADPRRPNSQMRAIGRLAPGLDISRAQEMADALAASLAEISPREAGWMLRLLPLDERRTTARTRRALLMALAAAGLLLVVAVVNVAQVALARAIQREGELAVRAALGAGKGRIIRQVLLESLLLGLGGGLFGVCLAVLLVSMITAAAPANLLRLDAIAVGVEWRAFAVALGLSIVAGMAAGLFPAWSASRPAVRDAVHGGSRSGGVTRKRRRLQSVLIVAEAALCLVLLAGAGLLWNSFERLTSIDPGFDVDALTTLVMQLDGERYPNPEARLQFLRSLEERIEALPGVSAATIAGGRPPLPGGVLLVSSLEPDGGERIEESTVLPYGQVAGDFFQTVGVEIIEGRALRDRDHETDNVVINEPLARLLFGELTAVGRRFRIEEEEGWTVVGVAASTPALDLSGKGRDLQLYRPLRSERTPRSYASIIVRADDPIAIAPMLQEALWDLDPQQAVHRIEPGADRIADWVLEPRFNLLLFGTFAAVGLALVLVGIGGVVGHVVASRTREIGIRVALGADRASILRLATLGSLRPVAAGLALGGLAAWQTTHLIGSLLYSVEPNDPPTLIAVALVFVLATLVASYIPARRALRVDPVRALRSE